MRKLLLFACLITCWQLGSAQNATVRGTIKSTDGNVLSGVSVSVKGMSRGVASDADGRYTIQAPPDAVLRFSYVGMETIEKAVNGSTALDIVMKGTPGTLNDVVVIGYGSVRKRDLTGSVSVIRSEELNVNNPLTLEQGLQGKIAGVNVISNDGAPGGGMSIQIRGSNTFSGSGEPLYVVDGVPINGSNSQSTPMEGSVTNPNGEPKGQTNSLAFLDPKDIASIEILKDASATAIYGSKGANGVVLISTKRGKEGRPQIDASAQFSISNIIHLTEVMSGTEYTRYINDVKYWTNYWKFYDPATGTSSYVPTPKDYTYPGMFDYDQGTYLKGPDDYSNERNIWQRAILQTARNQQYSVGISGGSKTTTYALRFNRADQEGIISGTKFQRNGLNFNITQKAYDWLSIGTNANVALTHYNLVNTASTNDFAAMGLIKTAIYARPVDAEVPRSFLDEGGFYATSSPLAYVATPDNTDQISLFANLFSEITFHPTLKFRTNIGYQLGQSQRHKYYNNNLYEGRSAQSGDGKVSAGFNKNASMSFENTLTFDKRYNRHHLNLMGTFSLSKYEWNNYSLSVMGFGTDVTQGYDMGRAIGIPSVWSVRGESSLMSYLGRVSYDYDSRYYLTASVRHDGASNFAANNKWATFYSFAGAYNLAGESFMKDINWLELFKLRYSYGFTGNQGIGAYASLPQYGGVNYPFEGVVENGYVLSGTSPGNANLKWETTRQNNFGIDVDLFSSRLHFTMDVYKKYTYDLLQYKSLAMSTGVQQQPMNVGAVENKGVEFSLSGTPVSNRDFKWEVSANWSTNKNKVLKFGENAAAQDVYGPYQLEGLLLKEGFPIGQLYGYEELGYWNSIEEYKTSSLYKYIVLHDPSSTPSDELIAQNYLGEIRYRDLNNDSLIDERDRGAIGNVNPDFIFGINNRFEYKNFSLNIFLQGVQGNDVLNAILLNFNTTSTWANRPPDQLDHAWTPELGKEQPAAILYPKKGQSYSRKYRFSRRFIEDGSYLKIKNINLSYTFKNFFKLKEVKNLTLSFSVNNVHTFTKYTGFDPEVNSAGSGNASWRGIDVGAYPSSRTYLFSIQANL